MPIQCAVCLLPLQCTGRILQGANSRIEVSPKEHMSFCLRSHKVPCQFGKSAVAIILLQIM